MTKGNNGGEAIPSFPAKHWFNLRKQFQKAIPKEVTPSYLATVLDMQEISAKNNIHRPMKIIGLISQDNKPTELANRWRHDDEYKDVCAEIVNNIYPQGLKDAFQNPTNDDFQRVKSWFSRNMSVGEAAADKMASLFILLHEADLSKVEDYTRNRKGNSENNSKPLRLSGKKTKAENGSFNSQIKSSARGQNDYESADDKTANDARPQPAAPNSLNPSLHIDLQIHISPESSTDQIDAIFSSMAKYLNINNED